MKLGHLILKAWVGLEKFLITVSFIRSLCSVEVSLYERLMWKFYLSKGEASGTGIITI